jgi:Protein of unknown function (DUF1592)/Protein of unknown function (DUF1588)/Protein of unknown function (DUF1587)/Protein of unknown function (DUF1585)/Protein of unknown function (DUF1595)/Planctomycete cytochrome C
MEPKQSIANESVVLAKLRRRAAWLILLLTASFSPAATADAAAPAEPELSAAVDLLPKLGCLECHSNAKSRGGLNLETMSRDLGDPSNASEWTYLYDRVRRDEMPPRDEERTAAGFRTAFLHHLGEALSREDLNRRSRTGRVVMRRLNRVEYENTVHDLLAVDTPLADLLPPDGEASGFDTVGEALRLSSAHLEGYLGAGRRALDAAIQLGEAPRSRTIRVRHLDLAAVQARLARKHGSRGPTGEAFHQVHKSLSDALVLFRAEPDGLTALRDARAAAPGLYRVRLSGFAHQSDRRNITLRLFAVSAEGRRPVGALELAPAPGGEVEAVVRLEKDEIIDVAPVGCERAPDGSTIEMVGAAQFQGPGAALRWVEVEGPVHVQWPPASVAKVFGDIPMKPTSPAAGERAFQPAPREPKADLKRVLHRFANRAFRHPAADGDVATYLRLAEEAMAGGASFEEAVRRGCLAMLVSPDFLFLRESRGRLDDYALASRLSYFLWSGPPDDELMRLAAQGRLRDPAVLRAQTDRLLDHRRSRAFVRNFCGQWLNLRAIDATQPDKTLYPEYDDALRDSMIVETELYFGELVRTDARVTALVDADFAMLNPRLAAHYRIPGVDGEGFRKVRLPAGSHRGGLLTQASVLKVTANGTSTSPVIRGAWVMRRILGREPRPPPADAGSIEPDTRGATTIREQLIKHRRSPSCGACHQYIDPPGFALENYDVIGGWREQYRAQGSPDVAASTAGAAAPTWHPGPPVDPGGEMADGRKFTDIESLKVLLLAQADEIARTFVGNLAVYATGGELTFADRAQIGEIVERSRSKGLGLRTMIHELIQSPLFQVN